MPEQRIVVETAALAAADTATAVTTFFGLVDPDLQVPGGVRRLKAIRVAIASDGAALGSAVFALELVGNGLHKTPQRFILGGSGGELVTGAQQVTPSFLIDVDIPAEPGTTFTATVYKNTDVGDVAIGLEFIFE
jgi:hypothetical protein